MSVPGPARLRTWLVPLLLGVACLIVYNANFKTIALGDSYAARFQPLILWQDQTLALDDHLPLVALGHPPQPPAAQAVAPDSPDYVSYFNPDAYWIAETRDGDGFASLYPVVTPLLVAPLYLPAYLWLESRGWKQPDVDRVAVVMEKLSASLLAALASVLMLLLLRREKIPWALPLAVAFAFGTNTWAISSQALWQHGTGELLMVVALLLVLGRRTPLSTGLLGLVCVLMVANRPPDAILAAGFLLYVAWRDKRDVKWLVAGGALPVAGLLAYNLVYIGSLFGGYVANPDAGRGFFRFSLTGPAGLLVSPGRGLLVFAPFLLFLPVGIAHRLRDPATRKLTIVLCGVVVTQIVMYGQTDWRAGSSWGPRFLTDMLPILVWLLAPAPQALRPAARRALVATIVVAVGIQAIGAFWYDGTSDERLFATADPRSVSEAWKPANTPFLVELEHGPTPGDLQCGARGVFERIGANPPPGDGTPVRLEPGATLSGWAFACKRTPAQVVALIDGAIVGNTQTFTPRPDVDATLGTSGFTGWSVPADIDGLAPGVHTLQLAVRVQPRSEFRRVREIAVEIPAPTPPSPAPTDLPGMATRAAERIAEHQRPDGAWLTTFTGTPRYEGPTDELNTYTTSVLTDLLAPLDREHGLGDAAAGARRHLTAQVEPSGLVRYHGLPDAPGIGTLGCRITPDADDTALAWRIAGLDRKDPRAREMLRTLRRYRGPDGLYRTWLSPKDRYECIDPGRDPNPADLVINMHVYLMLRELDRPAARSLCRAMRRAARADDHVVYYDRAPLVPYLRGAELRGLGCRLELPRKRLAQAEDDQEPWVQLVRALVAGRGGGVKTTELLTRLGADDFALLRRTPPLLYHNDLTASVRRYYWSQDVGYALWLRLYAATQSAP